MYGSDLQRRLKKRNHIEGGRGVTERSEVSMQKKKSADTDYQTKASALICFEKAV